MKQNAKIALSGMITAFSSMLMLLAYFPYLTYAIPALAGLFLIVIVIEINKKWAAATYIATSIITFLFAEPEAKLLFICFFGFYPILKAVIEKIGNQIIEWVLKFLTFNASMLAIYLLFSSLFNISLEDFGTIGQYGAVAFLALGNVVFVLYDISVGRMATLYLIRFHKQISRLFKVN